MGSPEPRSIRIGNAEREQAVMALGEHFAQGRLGSEEFEERMTAAYAARTAADLDRLFDDLPAATPQPPPTAQHPTARHPTAQHPISGYPTHAVPAHPGPAGAGYPSVVVPYGHRDPDAPYGREPMTGQPYSDRSKVIAGLLQLFLPLGIGRLYTGHVGIGVAQLITSFFGIGLLWAFIDGIVILCGRPTDSYGRPLRP